MTSFAFILGCVPLWIAAGSGAASRRILGTVVVSGMLAATLLGDLPDPDALRAGRTAGDADGRRSQRGALTPAPEAERIMTHVSSPIARRC